MIIIVLIIMIIIVLMIIISNLFTITEYLFNETNINTYNGTFFETYELKMPLTLSEIK